MAKKILIIDDDKILSKATGKRLIKRGYDVTVIHQAVEGLKIAKSTDQDLVLLDIKMPDLAGTEVLRQIRQSKEKNILPVIMVTSCDDQEDVVNALSIGANDYVTKPINIDILCARIETQIEMKILAEKFAEQKELQAITAMISTFNHEINNPLMAAFGILSLANKNNNISSDVLDKLKKSLTRIQEIVVKVDKVAEKNGLSYASYNEYGKMVDLS